MVKTACWTDYSSTYDALNFLIPYRRMVLEVISMLSLNPQNKILDAACGTGNLGNWIKKTMELQRAPKITGVDFNPGMLKKCKSKNTYELLVSASLNDRLPFRSNSFCQVASVLSLYITKNPLKTLGELKRVLEPNGDLILVTPKKNYENGLILKEHCGDNGPDKPWLNIHKSAKNELDLIKKAKIPNELIPIFIKIAAVNKDIQLDPFFHFWDPDELVKLVKQAGFRVVSSKLVSAKQDILIKAKNAKEVRS